MARVWAATLVAVLVTASHAEAGKTAEKRYWTEAKQDQVRTERSQIAQVARASMNAVVSITTVQPPDTHGDRGEDQTGLGTGFVIHEDGYILTAAHVVDGATEIRIGVLNEEGFTEEHSAQVLGVDKATDCALLKAEVGRKLPVLPLGTASDVDIADWVVVIGNPFGLGHSVSVGVVSFKGRTDVTPTGLEGSFDYIQTDAAINPGNSGGPVVDIHGNVVAIANAVNVSGQGIGFAIPIDIAKAVVPQLINYGRVRRGWAGISIQDLTPEIAARFKTRRAYGVLISDVIDGSPAERAGLKRGDVILSVDDVRTLHAGALRWRVSSKGVGRKVKLQVERNGKPVSLELTLGEKPKMTMEPIPLTSGDVEPTRLTIGAAVDDVDLEVAREAGLAEPLGVLVEEVSPGSVGAEAGLEEGDIVLKVNRTEIGSRDEFVRVLDEVSAGDWVRLYVRRGLETRALTFRMP
jgi:serine protease Do